MTPPFTGSDPYATPAAAGPEPPPGERPRFPGWVKTVSILWILYGTLRLLSSLGMVAVIHASTEKLTAFQLIALAIPVTTGLFFLWTGIQTRRGTISGLKINGIISIATGVVLLGGMAVLLQLSENLRARDLLILAVLEGILIANGILALTINARYLAWKHWGMLRH
jgi:hypothetical protein